MTNFETNRQNYDDNTGERIIKNKPLYDRESWSKYNNLRDQHSIDRNKDVNEQSERLTHHFELHKSGHFSTDRLTSYTSYSGINADLIGAAAGHHGPADVANIEQKVKGLDEQFDRHAAKGMPEDVHVYSGVGFNPKHHFDAANGVFHSPAYISTSLHPKTAKEWSTDGKDSHGERDAHMIHFHLPKGSKHGLHIEPISEWSGEREVLIRRNTKWKLAGHQVIHEKSIYDDHRADTPTKTMLAKQTTHIWSVVPHEDEPATPLKELFEPLSKDEMNKQFSDDHYQHHGLTGYIGDDEYKHAVQGGYKEHPDIKKQDKMLKDLHHANISNESRKAVYNYTGGDTWAHELLGSSQSWKSSYHATTQIHNLDKAIQDAPALDHNAHVYSGVGFNPSKILRNKVFKSPAFISTSLNPDVAMGVAKSSFDKPHIIHFDLHKGFNHSIYASGNNVGHEIFNNQRELILGRGQKFKVVAKHELPEGGTVWHVRHIDDPRGHEL